MTERELNSVFHDVFSGPNGEAVLEYLVEEFYDVSTYAFGVNYNYRDTIYAEGCRNVVAMILGRINLHKSGDDAEPTHGVYV